MMIKQLGTPEYTGFWRWLVHPKTGLSISLLNLSLAFFVMFAGIAELKAVPPKWSHLGSRTVNHTADRDEIMVTRSEGTFNAIKLKVKHKAVRFKDMKVHFAKGSPQDVKIANNIPAGGETRVIDIKGKDRVIKKVVFWYTTASPGKGKRAVVELFGRR